MTRLSALARTLALAPFLFTTACARYAPRTTTAASTPPHLIFAQATPTQDAPPPATATEPPPVRESTPPKDDRSSSRDTLRTVGWISIGVGSVAAAIALGTSAIMLHDNSVRNSGCDANKSHCSADAIEANNALGRMGGWNAGAYIVGAIGLVGGAFLVLTNPANAADAGQKDGEKLKNDAKPQTAVGMTPNASGASLVLRSSF